MSIFRDDLFRINFDEFLSEPVVRDLLFTLFELVPFFTTPQINQFLKRNSPRGFSGRSFHDGSRTVRTRLVEGGYLRKVKVELLPPVTIGLDPLHTFLVPESSNATSKSVPGPSPDAPLAVVLDYSIGPHGFFVSPHESVLASQLTEETLDGLAVRVRARVPKPELHQTTGIYWATHKVGDLVRSGFYASGETKRETQRTGCRTSEVEALVARQPRELNGVPPPPSETALSDLTAAINLTQLYFTDAGTCAHHEQPGRYEVLTQGRPVGRMTFGSASTLPDLAAVDRASCGSGRPHPAKAEESRSFYFLGPLHPHAVRDQLLHDVNSLPQSQQSPSAVWWM